MRISIVTLNYNGSKETIGLLKSLENQSDTDFKVIVIDNASEEADFANLQTGINQFIHMTDIASRLSTLPTCDVGHQQVETVRNSENFGFSGGNNVGIRHALDWNKEADPVKSPQRGDNGASWVVLLNNDTWVERNFMERLKVILSVKTGVIAIPLIEGDQVAYCGKIQWLKPTLIHIPTCDVGNPQVYAIGGAVAIHKDVCEKIGLLDEKYFLYFEDANFSVRARKAGFNISIAENLNVHHRVSSSTKKLGSPLLLRYHYRNALYFNFKNGPWHIKLLIWPWSWVILFKQLTKIVINKNKKESVAILKGVVDFYLRRFGKIK